MRQAESLHTWTSVNFTACGEVTTAMAIASKEVLDPSEEDKEEFQFNQDRLGILAAMDCIWIEKGQRFLGVGMMDKMLSMNHSISNK